MDGVFLGEANSVGTFEDVEVGQEGVDEGGGGGAAEEECRFGVFDGKGFLFGEGSLRTCVFGFAVELVNSLRR